MWLNPQKTAHLVKFPEEILNGKLNFLYNEKACARGSFLIKFQAEACSLTKKETLAQLFSGEFCKFSKNIFLTEHTPGLLVLKPEAAVAKISISQKIFTVQSNKINTRKKCEICSKLIEKKPERSLPLISSNDQSLVCSSRTL